MSCASLVENQVTVHLLSPYLMQHASLVDVEIQNISQNDMG
jgi:hypothetical protein